MSDAKMFLMMILLRTKGSEWYGTVKLFRIFHIFLKIRHIQTADLKFGLCFYRTNIKNQECPVATAKRFIRFRCCICLLSEGFHGIQIVVRMFRGGSKLSPLTRVFLWCIPTHLWRCATLFVKNERNCKLQLFFLASKTYVNLLLLTYLIGK